MVQRLSAQLVLPGEYCYEVPSNHTDMVKFESHENKAFQTVLTSMAGGIEELRRETAQFRKVRK